MSQTINLKSPPEAQPQYVAGSAAAKASELLGRYPNLSETELALLINLYRDFSALDMALMVSDERLGPKFDLFSTENRSRIRTPFRHYAALVGTGVLGIFAIAWALVFA
jgi:hypothetical protein